ncbi:AAA-domain-containing protein [Yamadazyma tenuis ATCC 10573]|uniref:AAA-domain-containing protein n=1 Tax=Candida tenuis (strain ATCC 10573 / BCRC 21748 / CBS 615 / JCM 9827 / NBRC 10315 / NRRL Y-1498 / VKM Y-70) TaxID=590646 RepID=G3AWB8_CANTC|nr:AAA-domain-containing protein [Yamadazyma tenuis ATCC 10573]EGV66505.1 AAA-domain-containing protein [Yamadazyma tenuis ATCC 10573]
MSRRSRNTKPSISDDEDDGFNSQESDKDELEGSDSIPSDNDKDQDDYLEDDEDNEDDDEIRTSRRRKASRARALNDEFTRKLTEKRFIASDEDVSDDYEYGQEPVKKKKRSRSRSVEPVFLPKRGRLRSTRNSEAVGAAEEAEAGAEDGKEESEEEVEDDIKKELAALYDSSPEPELKHKLRERAPVDYAIPPPITNDAQLEAGAPITPSFTKGRRGRPSTNKSEYRNLLFPTAGPFGGSDVISVFGTNIPPGGIPIPGMSATNNNMTAIGQALSDSDSSDDEIAPINGEATITKKQPKDNFLNHTKLIGTSTAKHQNKKKNNLSDTDPLGVDMNIDFSAVGGLDEYINQLKEMVALPLLYPELYQNFAITPPRGVLFHGPPGTGKTLMARALAASFSTSTRKITFFMRKGADCLSKWVGEAERQLRLLFEEAKNQQPSIIFFDEIDGLAPVRSSKQEQIHASIVSTLLALMDGMDNRGQVIVIGATNRPDAIDPALRRPGRFDREFYFPLPDTNARSQILKIHTKKWSPPLGDEFLGKIADLTKGYGGADLRALCTEAALNSIQRKYPQIYQSNQKLEVVPSKVKVIAKDFMNAMEKIVPSSARSTSSGSAPLPQHLKCLLEPQYNEIILKLNNLLPNSIHLKGEKKKTQLEDALYLDPTIHDEDGGFARQEFLKNLENSRICKPSLLISGESGSGQQYIGAALLNHLEGFQVQSLDIGAIFSDSTRTPESAIIQTFIEARRHQPSVIFIPNIDIWYHIVPPTAKATLSSLLKSLKSNEKILLLGISESSQEALDYEVKLLFASTNETNSVTLHNPDVGQRRQFFGTLKKTLLMKPYEFVNDFENRPKRKLKQLKVVEEVVVVDKDSEKKKLKAQEYQDTKLKNTLKIKLASLMDLFKVRYKRFKKPIIDENLLSHIFYPEILSNPLNVYEVLYEKAADDEHKDMIKELATGKYYHNIDLDIIEERLWNGYYSEPRQFLKDIKMIVSDSIMSGDRERILKANEMLTNAQFGIDDIGTPEFLSACKEMRKRELVKQAQVVADYQKLQEAAQKQQEANGSLQNGNAVNGEPEEISVETQDDQEPVVATDVKIVADVEQETAIEPRKEQTAVAKPPIPGSDSESEAEDSPIDISRQLVLGGDHEEFFSNRIIEITSNCNIERLEIVMARLMDIIWTDRNQWDKTQTIKNLYNAADSIEAEIS